MILVLNRSLKTMWSLLASGGAIKVRPIISVQAHTSRADEICTVLK